MTETFNMSVHIEAPPDEVYDHFVRPDLLVRWMGEHAKLEAVNGGIFSVDIDGVLIRGEFTLLERPSLIEIAWGEAGNELMPPGATRVSISLQAVDGGTSLMLTHSGLEPSEAEKHAYGWPHFLDRLATAATGRDPGPYPWKIQQQERQV